MRHPACWILLWMTACTDASDALNIQDGALSWDSTSPEVDTGLVTEDTGSTDGTVSTSCALEWTRDELQRRILWTLQDEEASENTVSAWVTWYDGLVQQEIVFKPGLHQGSIDFLPRRIPGHGLQDAFIRQGGDPSIDIRLDVHNQANSLICSTQFQTKFFPMEPIEHFDVMTQPTLSAAQWTEQHETTLSNQLGMRVIQSQSLEMEPHRVLFETFLTGDVLSVLNIDRDLLSAYSTIPERAHFVGSVTPYRGDLLIMTDCTVGVAPSELYRFDLGSQQFMEHLSLEAVGTLDEDLCLHHRLFTQERGLTGIPHLNAIRWRDTPGRPLPASESVIIQLQEDALDIVKTTPWFDPSQVSSGEYIYGNATSLSPPGHDGIQLRSDSYPINNLQEPDLTQCKNLVVAGDPHQSSPRFLFYREGCESEAFAKNPKDVYPGIQLIALPDDPADGRPALDFPHDAVVWSTSENEHILVLYSLGMDTTPEMTFPKVHLFSFRSNQADTAAADHLCTHVSDTHASTNGSLVPLNKATPLMGVFLGNETGDIHWISTNTADPSTLCDVIGTQQYPLSNAERPFFYKWMEHAPIQHLSHPDQIAHHALRVLPSKAGDGLFAPPDTDG